MPRVWGVRTTWRTVGDGAFFCPGNPPPSPETSGKSATLSADGRLTELSKPNPAATPCSRNGGGPPRAMTPRPKTNRDGMPSERRR